jgi:hypothetical protein
VACWGDLYCKGCCTCAGFAGDLSRTGSDALVAVKPGGIFSFPGAASDTKATLVFWHGDRCWSAELLAAEIESSSICVRNRSSTAGSSTSRLLSRDLASSNLRADTAVLPALWEFRGLRLARLLGLPAPPGCIRNRFAGFDDRPGESMGASACECFSGSSSAGWYTSSSAAVSVAESQAGLSSRTGSSAASATSLFLPVPLPLTNRVIRSWLGRTSTMGSPLRFFASITFCSFSFFFSRRIRALLLALRFSSSSLISLLCSASYLACSAFVLFGSRVACRWSFWACLDVMGRWAGTPSPAGRWTRPCMPSGLGTMVKVRCCGAMVALCRYPVH